MTTPEQVKANIEAIKLKPGQTKLVLRQLQECNQEYQYYHRTLNADDLRRVNALIRRSEARIELPTPGDLVNLTTDTGKNYPRALYQQAETSMGNVCEEAYVPFLGMYGLRVNASGGAWKQITAQELIDQTPTPSKIGAWFKIWGTHGAHGTIQFPAIVNLWQYNQQTQQGEQTR